MYRSLFLHYNGFYYVVKGGNEWVGFGSTFSKVEYKKNVYK